MWKYLFKRFLLMFPTLFGVALLTFVLIRVIPGDVVELRYSGDRGAVSQEVLDKERARFGLDRPLWKQFGTWVLGIARLDFGESMWTGAPIWQEIRLRFALSLQVAIMATAVAVVLAIPLGVVAALKQDSWVDYTVRIFSIAGLATPSFWLGIVFILLLLVVFHWLPPMIYTRSEEHTSELQSRLHLVCRLLLEKKKILVCVALSRGSAPLPSLPAILSRQAPCLPTRQSTSCCVCSDPFTPIGPR